LNYLDLVDVSKSFGPFRALSNLTLSVARGEIHAILGENGAGKTTLMNIIFGLYRPSSGTLSVKDQEVSFNSPADAIRCGIGMIHQHFHLAGALSVVENVILGMRGNHKLSLAQHAIKITQISKEYGFEVDPYAKVSKLPIGMRQRVEIIKALYRNVELLVLDEPTSVLAPGEISGFLDGLRKLRLSGKTILFITHKLDEVMSVCDRVTVIRRGQVVNALSVSHTTAAGLASAMIGTDIPVIAKNRTAARSSSTVLSIDRICAVNDRGAVALNSVSFNVRAGEVIGIAGVDGNGQKELAEAIVGLRQITDGDIRVNENSIRSLTVHERLFQIEIGFVPEDRHEMGLVLDYSVAQNLVLRDFDRSPVSRYGIISHAAINERADRLVEQYDIRLEKHSQVARMLSGGNQQKIILAREISAMPKVLVVMQATKGLDVGAIAFVQNKILEERARGVAILYISTELEHVLEVADYVGVMCAGQLSPLMTRGEATLQRIGMYMAGINEDAA
jgi:general nucleoside transport system ATP-binding protein